MKTFLNCIQLNLVDIHSLQRPIRGHHLGQPPVGSPLHVEPVVGARVGQVFALGGGPAHGHERVVR